MHSKLTLLKHLVARNSPALVALTAGVGLVISVAILGLPEAGADLAARASVSTAAATVFALFAAIMAVSAAVWVTTSDYRAREAIKRDTARIRAAVRIIMYKCAVPKNASRDIFKAERDLLSEFLSSTTGFAYQAWVERRVSESVRVGKQDDWGVFFPDIVSLVDACEPPVNRAVVLNRALKVDNLLVSLRRSDVQSISSYTNFAVNLGDGKGVLTSARDWRTAKESPDVVQSSLAAVYDSRETRWKFQHLKKKGVVDPNVDLFVAVFGNDLEALKAALEAGADTSATDKQVLAAHQAELNDFDPADALSKASTTKADR